MKVGVISPWYPTAKRPTLGLFVKREVDALKQAGLDVRVIHLDRELSSGQTSLSQESGVPVLRIGMNPANPVSVAGAIPELKAATEHLDLVNSHAISALPAVAALRLRRRGKPWVHTEHWSALASADSASPILRFARPAFGALLKLPDIVVAESERLISAVKQFRGDKPTRLIPCVVPVPDHVAPLDLPDWASSTNSKEKLRLVSTGGVIDRKNPRLAVEAVAELERNGFPTSLRWCGEGDLIEECTKLADDLGVDATFLGGQTPEQVVEELANAHVFIAPTKGDNFFVAVAEALANGRPVCASDQGGHVEYVDPRYSEIVTEQTAKAYGHALVELVEKCRNVTAEQISKSVADRFSPHAVATKYLEVYQTLMTDTDTDTDSGRNGL